MHAPRTLVDIEVLGDKIVGEGGFLAVRRLELANVHADGSRSRAYRADFVVRQKGSDAVVVAIYRRTASGGAQVLLRDGMRPPLRFGRRGQVVPVPDEQDYPFFREAVAGILEAEDRGEAGVIRRACVEAKEEAGIDISRHAVRFLGAGTFPSPGVMAEKLWLVAADATDSPEPSAPTGDGSPMEEGATTHWLDLEQAIGDCVSGAIQDAKTEIVLRRLRELLRDESAP